MDSAGEEAANRSWRLEAESAASSAAGPDSVEGEEIVPRKLPEEPGSTRDWAGVASSSSKIVGKEEATAAAFTAEKPPVEEHVWKSALRRSPSPGDGGAKPPKGVVRVAAEFLSDSEDSATKPPKTPFVRPPLTGRRPPAGILKSAKHPGPSGQASATPKSQRKKHIKRGVVVQSRLIVGLLATLGTLLLFGDRLLPIGPRQARRPDTWVETAEEVTRVFDALERDVTSGGLAFEMRKEGIQDASLLRELRPVLSEKLKGKDAGLAKFIATSSEGADQVHRAAFRFRRLLTQVRNSLQRSATGADFEFPEETRSEVASALEQVVRAALRFQQRVKEAVAVATSPQGLMESVEANAVWLHLLELSDVATALAVAQVCEDADRWGLSESKAVEEAKTVVEATLKGWTGPPSFAAVSQELRRQIDSHGMPSFVALTLSPMQSVISSLSGEEPLALAATSSAL